MDEVLRLLFSKSSLLSIVGLLLVGASGALLMYGQEHNAAKISLLGLATTGIGSYLLGRYTNREED